MILLLRHVAALALLLAGCDGQDSPVEPGEWPGAGRALWIDREVLRALPASGAAYERLVEIASRPVDEPRISDQDDETDVRVLAKALLAVHRGDQELAGEVAEACLAAIGTERGGRVLALGRNLVGYVLAADLVGLEPEQDLRFRAYLDRVRRSHLDGRTLIEVHEVRPNNWGTHAGAARIAIAAYLGDRAELERACDVFRGWLGERDVYAGFRFGDPAWAADPERPVGVNPRGARRDGHSIDGVLPDDQRRGGRFTWPPPSENYVYEALQGALVQSVLLERQGFDVRTGGDHALERAYRWLLDEAEYPPEGDDRWQAPLARSHLGVPFEPSGPTQPGKNVGFTCWTHADPESR